MPNPRIFSIAAAAVLILLVIGLRSYVSVPTGHAKDPASKLYFMDGSSPMPLPLMHMGESGTSAR